MLYIISYYYLLCLTLPHLLYHMTHHYQSLLNMELINCTAVVKKNCNSKSSSDNDVSYGEAELSHCSIILYNTSLPY